MKHFEPDAYAATCRPAGSNDLFHRRRRDPLHLRFTAEEIWDAEVERREAAFTFEQALVVITVAAAGLWSIPLTIWILLS